MPRKQWRTRLSSYDIPKIDPNDRSRVEDEDLARHALVDFDELAVIPSKAHARLHCGPSGRD